MALKKNQHNFRVVSSSALSKTVLQNFSPQRKILN